MCLECLGGIGTVQKAAVGGSLTQNSSDGQLNNTHNPMRGGKRGPLQQFKYANCGNFFNRIVPFTPGYPPHLASGGVIRDQSYNLHGILCGF